jgi:hypothetical protein
MMSKSPCRHTAAMLLMLFFSLSVASEKSDSTTVHLTRERKSIYAHLNSLSSATGFNFIYDSEIIDNNKKVRTRQGEFTLEEAVKMITENPDAAVSIKGTHALIFIRKEKKDDIQARNTDTKILNNPGEETRKEPDDDNDYLIIKATVADKITGEPLAFAHVTMTGSNSGTVTNTEGAFRINISDTSLQKEIKISYLGYKSIVIPITILLDRETRLMMEPRIIPLQEVTVKVSDPVKMIREMLSSRSSNYNTSATRLTTFYREGTEYDNSLDLTEAVLEIVKPGVFRSSSKEQVRVLKMRKITNAVKQDTLVAKLKSSISSALLLDIASNLPQFLDNETMELYKYSHTNITTLDNRRVHVISFAQKEQVSLPLYKGELYIDAQNSALVEARFCINPRHIRKAKTDLIVKESRNIRITPLSAQYIVSYKPHDGIYHISHVRGDLGFRIKRRRSITSSPLNIWFEMATCVIDTSHTLPIEKEERINPSKVFSETVHSYDTEFWKNFNIILPEEKIIEIIENYNFNL